MSLALLGSAHATVLLAPLDIISSPGIGSGTLGTVTLTQNGADEVDVALVLAPDTYFVSTGGPHHAFTFNLDNPSSAVKITLANSVFAFAGMQQRNIPYGIFTYGIDCPDCGPGSSHEYPGPLQFTITDASGISVDDFIANSGGYFFSADVKGPHGGMGNIASNDPAAVPVPEPASLALLGSALFGLSIIRRRWSRTHGLHRPSALPS